MKELIPLVSKQTIQPTELTSHAGGGPTMSIDGPLSGPTMSFDARQSRDIGHLTARWSSNKADRKKKVVSGSPAQQNKVGPAGRKKVFFGANGSNPL